MPALPAEAGVSPRRTTYFLACQKVSKEHGPTVCVPALRYGKTCVTPFGLGCRPTHCAAAHAAQTYGGKSDNDTLALFGANVRNPNGEP